MPEPSDVEKLVSRSMDVTPFDVVEACFQEVSDNDYDGAMIVLTKADGHGGLIIKQFLSGFEPQQYLDLLAHTYIRARASIQPK